MTNLIPIQITLQAASAADAQKLVHDLAGTMRGEKAVPQIGTAQSPEPQPQQPQPSQQQYPFAPQFPTAQPPVAPPTQSYAPPVGPPAGVPVVGQALPVAPPAPIAPQGVPVTSAPAYTMEQLGVAAGPLVDAGRAAELTGWLQQRGVTALTQLDPAYYGEFATYLRSLGAQI